VLQITLLSTIMLTFSIAATLIKSQTIDITISTLILASIGNNFIFKDALYIIVLAIALSFVFDLIWVFVNIDQFGTNLYAQWGKSSIHLWILTSIEYTSLAFLNISKVCN